MDRVVRHGGTEGGRKRPVLALHEEADDRGEGSAEVITLREQSVFKALGPGTPLYACSVFATERSQQLIKVLLLSNRTTGQS